MLQLEGITIEELTKQIENLQWKPIVECADNPILFIERFCKIRHPVKGLLPFKLYDYQKEMLNVMHDNRHSIHLTARQMGSTHVSAGYLLWYATFNGFRTVLSIHPNKKMAESFMDTVLSLYDSVPEKYRQKIVRQSKVRLEFENGAIIRIDCASKNSGRGMGISLLHLGDFGNVDETIQNEMWASLWPCLATGSKCVITGCSGTTNGIFYALWTGALKGHNKFAPYKITWTSNPDRDEEWKQEMTHFIGEESFKREFECQFEGATDE